MRTTKSTLVSVIGRDASGAPAELAGTDSEPSRAPSELPEKLTEPSRAPAELPNVIAERFEAPAETSETLSGSKRAPAIRPEIFAASPAAPGRGSKSLAGSRKATAITPAIPANPKIDPAVARTIPSHPKVDPAVAPAVARLPLKPSAADFEHAYQSLLPELRALRRSQVVPINIDIPGAVTKALRIQPTLAELEESIARALPELGLRLPERLVTHALALSHAHALFLTVSQGVDALPSLIEEGKNLRAVLLADAQPLIRRGLIDAGVVRRLRADRGYATLAFDLQVLTELFRAYGASNPGLTCACAAELGRAPALAVTILTLLGRRMSLRADIEAAADLRRRAFTLFVRIYDQARRAMVFLRWKEGDADQLIPSLYAKRKHRREVNTADTQHQLQ